MALRETNPHGGGEVVAVFKLEIFRAFQDEIFADVFAAGDAEAFAELAAVNASLNLVADCFDGETVRGDIGRNFRIKL